VYYPLSSIFIICTAPISGSGYSTSLISSSKELARLEALVVLAEDAVADMSLRCPMYYWGAASIFVKPWVSLANFITLPGVMSRDEQHIMQNTTARKR